MTLPSRTAVFIQDACYKHKFIRSKDTSNIVERPERLKAVKLGLATVLARLEEVLPTRSSENSQSEPGADELTAALNRMKLDGTASSTFGGIPVVHSSASIPLLGNPAVKYIHGDIESDVYLEKLRSWAKESTEKIGRGESEIPEGLPQGDLYLCPESINAIEGALGTVCEAIDTIISEKSPTKPSSEHVTDDVSKAFVAVRPPGHHCGEDTPCGFCFVNNVAVGAAHAHLNHGINRVVIFDIDLHHGNGTQSIVWGINEETYRQTLEAEAGAPETKPGLKAYYGSIHDIMSFPCEDGKPELIQAASVSIHESHGQWIENIHLQAYEDETTFHQIYEKHYSKLIAKAEGFLDATGGPGDDVCGMDASEHEYSSMSRHGRKVPTSFFHRFTQDSCHFAEKYAKGRLVSVLEGGYSDRALISGTLAHLSGMVDVTEEIRTTMPEWWRLENLEKVEKMIKKKRNARPSSVGIATDAWLERTGEIFLSMDAAGAVAMATSARRAKAVVPTSTRVLRDRKARTAESTPATSPAKQANRPIDTGEDSSGLSSAPESETDSVEPVNVLTGELGGTELSKKLPRVILKLGPKPAV
ncbi:histone deacetylase [Marasmius crinis-equi]|uniref:Histone deacetylase n=1 Tax=Marasmius crinis-equi TaxID=585013 RepID=A0ABR3F3A8_9AGAR